ncbi:hypothetical protein BpHYR1_012053 [Brachionus plicatilis]|uniref:Uncharacterized protein n=1 Tax=Brachionus plicatilis TaxID=10195 RepID=A0A3M7SVB5_BRAPC|nr:hypothetical protein BpHYR1_012053 [Brachionus plicatilis]
MMLTAFIEKSLKNITRKQMWTNMSINFPKKINLFQKISHFQYCYDKLFLPELFKSPKKSPSFISKNLYTLVINISFAFKWLFCKLAEFLRRLNLGVKY